MKKEALLLIDIQDVYFTPGPLLLNEPRKVAKKAAELLQQFRAENKPIIHIQHNFRALSGIHKSVRPLSGETVIQKERPNSFFETSLQECLKSNNVERLVICGMMSHMCIDTTVRECQNYGYNVIVIEDACTTKDLKYKREKNPCPNSA